MSRLFLFLATFIVPFTLYAQEISDDRTLEGAHLFITERLSNGLTYFPIIATDEDEFIYEEGTATITHVQSSDCVTVLTGQGEDGTYTRTITWSKISSIATNYGSWNEIPIVRLYGPIVLRDGSIFNGITLSLDSTETQTRLNTAMYFVKNACELSTGF